MTGCSVPRAQAARGKMYSHCHTGVAELMAVLHCACCSGRHVTSVSLYKQLESMGCRPRPGETASRERESCQGQTKDKRTLAPVGVTRTSSWWKLLFGLSQCRGQKRGWGGGGLQQTHIAALGSLGTQLCLLEVFAQVQAGSHLCFSSC